MSELFPGEFNSASSIRRILNIPRLITRNLVKNFFLPLSLGRLRHLRDTDTVVTGSSLRNCRLVYYLANELCVLKLFELNTRSFQEVLIPVQLARVPPLRELN